MMTIGCEEWRDVKGYEGAYQVSNCGRVRSLDRRVRCGHNASRLVKGRVLKPAGNKYHEHLTVVLGHGKNASSVHQLVAEAFLGPRPKGQEVRHLDGNPLNNCADNLCYGTRTENIIDVMRIGKPWRKLCAEQVRDIRQRLQAGESGAKLAREYGVGEACISSIKVGRSFQWLK